MPALQGAFVANGSPCPGAVGVDSRKPGVHASGRGFQTEGVVKRILFALVLVLFASLACPAPQVRGEDPNPATRQHSGQEFRTLDQQGEN